MQASNYSVHAQIAARKTKHKLHIRQFQGHADGGRDYALQLPSTSSSRLGDRMSKSCADQGDAQPPATSTHSTRQLPCLPSTSTRSASHLHLQPTPFSFSGSYVSQYSSSSFRFFSSSVVFSRKGIRGNCLAGALAGQC